MISYYFPRIFARRAAFFSSERFKTMAVAMDPSYEPAQVPSKIEAAALVHGSFLELEAILLATSQGKPKSSYSGACVACLVKFGSYCVVASVGDSVVSLVSKDRTTGENVCTQINEEHVPTLQVEAVRVRQSLDLRDHVPFRPSMTAIIEKARKEMPARIDICQATAQTLLQRTRHFAHATGYREEGACSEQDKRIVCDALGLPSDFLDSIPLRLQGCYMMTRAMGDAHMKDKDCCGTEMHLVGTSLLGVPSVYHYDCCLDQDVAIVLATDGVTSGVFASQFCKSFGKAETLGDNAASMIVTGAIREALRRSKLSYAQLKMLTRGVARRSVIDDTTCLVVYFDDACSLLQ
jgi:serine/threonine protein phosphatase PrpC